MERALTINEQLLWLSLGQVPYDVSEIHIDPHDSTRYLGTVRETDLNTELCRTFGLDPSRVTFEVDKDDPTKLHATVRVEPLKMVSIFIPLENPMSNTDPLDPSKFEPGTSAEETLYLEVARSAHRINQSYCREIGDVVQSDWETLPPEKQASMIKGVAGIVAGNTPEQSHELWLLTHQALGWKLGPVRDEAKKEHPNMRPYNELPDAQRLKDTLFRTVVLGVLASKGVDVP